MKKKLWFLFLVLVGFAILQGPWKAYRTEGAGWDHEIYCRAITASQAGLDPFVTENLGLKLSYTYPGLFLKLYEPFCLGGAKGYLFYQVALMAIIAVLLIGKMKWDPFLVVTWLFLGFNAAYANYSTGNIGILEAFFFTLFLIGFSRCQKSTVLWLVPSAFFKIIPSVMALPAGFAMSRSWSERLKVLSVFGAGLLALEVFNYFYSPTLFHGFLRQITGGYGNQHSL